MKKTPFVFVLLFGLLTARSQVVFCPPGAEWHYLFYGTIFLPGNTYNEEIRYVNDTIDGPDTLKILSHYKFFMSCDIGTRRTYIKQKGDTIFFKNQFTQSGWQILYNFAAQPGQSWQTTILKNSFSSPVTFTFNVLAVNTITVDGFNLRQLTVTSPSWSGTYITERFGSSAFLFHFSLKSITSCDGGWFMESLCYTDSSMSTQQFGEKACDYRTINTVGINEEQNKHSLKLYPNPVNDVLTVNLNSSEEYELLFVDTFGRELKRVKKTREDKIPVNDLNKGVYMLIVLKDNSVIFKTKLIKE